MRGWPFTILQLNSLIYQCHIILSNPIFLPEKLILTVLYIITYRLQQTLCQAHAQDYLSQLGKAEQHIHCK